MNRAASDERRPPRHSRAQLLERAGGCGDGEWKQARERDTAFGAQDFEDAELRRIFTTQQVFSTGSTSFERHDVCVRHIVRERIRPGARGADESGQPPRQVILDETSHEIPFGRGARAIDDAGEDRDEGQACCRFRARDVERARLRALVIVRGERVWRVRGRKRQERRAAEMVDNPKYRAKLLRRMLGGKIAPPIELMLWYYAHGKPKETIAHEGLGLSPETLEQQAKATSPYRRKRSRC
jgi:hypothetical protein